MRDIVKVLTVIRHVPELPEGTEEWLYAIASKAMYTAPEMQHAPWDEAAVALWEGVGEPDCEWKRIVQDIFVGKLEADPRPATED